MQGCLSEVAMWMLEPDPWHRSPEWDACIWRTCDKFRWSVLPLTARHAASNFSPIFTALPPPMPRIPQTSYLPMSRGIISCGPWPPLDVTDLHQSDIASESVVVYVVVSRSSTGEVPGMTTPFWRSLLRPTCLATSLMTFIMLFLAFEPVSMQNLLDRKETRQMPPNISVATPICPRVEEDTQHTPG